MKGYKVPVAIGLIILIAAGWLNLTVFTRNSTNSEYEKIMSEANDSYDRGLYQIAASKYDEALQLKNTKETTDLLVKAWAAQYAQDVHSYADYLSALQKAIRIYPKNASYVMTAADLYFKDEKYEKAFTILKNAINIGIDNESVTKKYTEVMYSFILKDRTFSDFRACPDSSFLVSDGLAWGIISNEGYISSDYQYVYLSTPNSDGWMMYVDKDKARLIDKEDVVQGIFDKNLVCAGICAEDKIAVCTGNTYSYYSIRGDKLFGEYQNAGTFVNGQAAVNVNGKWGIVDAKGKYTVEPAYEDILLDSQGKYISQSVILAKTGGQYHLYDAKWKMIKEFACDQADKITADGLFAFSSGGKWGFADTKGNVIIKPVYENARSFSNGLAAVCKNGLWGFIDEKGNLVIPYQFQNADYFSEKGGCMVQASAGVWQLLLLNIRKD